MAKFMATGEAGDVGGSRVSAVPPMAELILAFSAPKLHEVEGKHRAAGTLVVKYVPAEGGRGIEGKAIEFVSPLGPYEGEILRWYIEDYCRWPFGPFRDRAAKVEAQLVEWGKSLYDAALAAQERPVRAFLEARSLSGGRVERRITVSVDDRGADGAGKEAAAMLFGLPWELLHDESSYLFDGSARARVRRALPSEVQRLPAPPQDKVRVLLVLARPDDEEASFLDPRASAMPLVEALRALGARVELDVLPDGTLAALREALEQADREDRPYQIVHFDGHGVYDRVRGLGMLCFEDAEDARLGLEKRRAHNVPATVIGGILRDRRVSLFVLDACQTAVAKEDPRASVAAELLRQGVVSVVAMRYSVLVETAKRFTEAFYGALARGDRIGAAMVAAQHRLKDMPVRMEFGTKGRLELSDWMVPVLFQEEDDPPIFARPADTRPAAEEERLCDERVRLGELPSAPEHGFVGRARDLLTIERCLARKRRVSIVGRGGEGKTALAVEAARWLLATRRVERIAFVSVERLSEARAMLDAIGRQLVPDFSVATLGEEGAIASVKSAVLERRTLLVVDNLESLMPLWEDPDATKKEAVEAILRLVDDLAKVTNTWLITTSREALPAPLDGAEMRLGVLSKSDARKLLVSVLREKGVEPPREEKAAEAMEASLDRLIEAVGGHARSLVLLGPTLARVGIEATDAAVRKEMHALEQKHPGERERSLLASVRIQLARLDEGTRRKIAPLCVFRQAAPVPIMAHVLEIEPDEALEICRKLVALGLADADGPYLLPDPALGEALALEMDFGARERAEQRWGEGMHAFAGALSAQESREARIAVHGTTVALVDMLEALDASTRGIEAGAIAVEAVMPYATCLESLVSTIGHPRALGRVRGIRATLAQRLPAWSRGRFHAESEEVDRRQEAGDMRGALERALRLRDQAEVAGDVYPEAAYHRAVAWIKLGRVLQMSRRAGEALSVLEEARRRFATLAEAGSTQAAGMETVAISEQGDALADLGRLNEAATAYEEAIRRAEARGARRSVAVGRGQLGMVRLEQGRLREALEAYHNAKRDFEALGEPGTVAGVWHQIGIVYQSAGKLEAAESAYRESLAIKVSLGDRAGEASTLHQLGSLYGRQGRLEEAAALYRQAAALSEQGGDVAAMSTAQNNLGGILHKLGRLDEARNALELATRIDARLGHAAQPWKTWWTLADVEHDAGRTVAAAHARAEATKTYRAYRVDGGEPKDGMTRLIARMGRLLQGQGTDAAYALLRKVRSDHSELDAGWLALLCALEQIVAGDRNPALTEDPDLNPIVAVELALLLETLSGPAS